MLIHLNSTEQLNQIIAENQYVIVDFYADWCGPCQRLGKVFESVKDELPFSQVAIVKVNVDEFNALAQSYGVFSIPSLFLFKDGQKLTAIKERGEVIGDNILGYRSPDDLRTIIFDNFNI